MFIKIQSNYGEEYVCQLEDLVFYNPNNKEDNVTFYIKGTRLSSHCTQKELLRIEELAKNGEKNE